MIELMRPNYILIIVEVFSDMNNVRRSFIDEPKGAPKILKEITNRVEKKLNKKFEVDFLIPIHFSIIKKPITIHIEGVKRPSTSRRGVGAMQLYEYIGSSDDLGPIMEVLSEFFRNKIEELKATSSKNWLALVTDYKIVLGKDYEEIK